MSMIVPNVEELVAADQRYRAINKLFNWKKLTKELRDCYSTKGRAGYAVEQGFRCLFLQFLEDKSDRQMEEFMRDSLAAKYFCSFGLTDQTPDHCYFGKFRDRIGTKRLANIFKKMVTSLKKQGLIREFYTFVDATKITACVDSWKARDRAVADKIYSDGKALKEIKRRGLHSMAIAKRNARDKNREKDSFISALRMPFEGVPRD